MDIVITMCLQVLPEPLRLRNMLHCIRIRAGIQCMYLSLTYVEQYPHYVRKNMLYKLYATAK